MTETHPTGLSQHPPAAITELEELKSIVMLQLPIHVWDIDMNTIREHLTSSLVPTRQGLVLNYQKGQGPDTSHYVRWFNIEDESYVTHNMDDTKFKAFHFGMYVFNSREEAVQAQLAYRESLKQVKLP